MLYSLFSSSVIFSHRIESIRFLSSGCNALNLSPVSKCLTKRSKPIFGSFWTGLKYSQKRITTYNTYLKSEPNQNTKIPILNFPFVFIQYVVTFWIQLIRLVLFLVSLQGRLEWQYINYKMINKKRTMINNLQGKQVFLLKRAGSSLASHHHA